MHPAIVWFGGGGGDDADPHTDIPLRCAHTLVEVAGPLVTYIAATVRTCPYFKTITLVA